MAQLWGQVAVVTGAARGIGRAIAERYAAEGATLIAVDIDEPAVEGLVAAIRDAGGEAEARIADLGEVETIAPLLRDIARCHDSVDILVNNAAVTRAIDFFSVRPEDWDLIHRVNARGLFFCMQAAAELMRQAGGGRILNVSSIYGRMTTPLTGWYQASKHALEAVSDALRMEVASAGVKVVLVEPGGFRTGIWDSNEAALARHEGSRYASAYEREQLILRLADRFLGDPAQVAEVIGHALRARAPRARYLVGYDAQALALVDRLAPTSIKDLVTRIGLGL